MGSTFGLTNRGPFGLRKDFLMVVLGNARMDILYSLEGPMVGWHGSSNRHCHGTDFI